MAIEPRILPALLTLGALPGLLVGQWQLALLVPVCVYLLWHLFQLTRLSRLLERRKWLRPPYPPGPWRDIYERIAAVQNRSRTRQWTLVRFTTGFRKAAAALPDAAAILDRDQEVQWANPAALPLLGVAWPASEGRPLLELVPHPVLREYFERSD